MKREDNYMAKEIKNILDRLDKLELKVTEIERINKLVLEEEIRKNILVVAEGNTELRHKQADTLTLKSENILLLIKTNVLESEVRLLKDKVKALSSVS